MASKRRASARTKAPASLDSRVEEVEAAIRTLREVADEYREAAASIEADGEMPHALIEIADLIPQAEGPVKDITSAFEAKALQLHDHGGSFEEGDDLIVSFKTQNGRISIQWKDEAMRAAKQAAELNEDEWSEDDYEKQVRARANYSSDKTKVEILRR